MTCSDITKFIKYTFNARDKEGHLHITVPSNNIIHFKRPPASLKCFVTDSHSLEDSSNFRAVFPTEGGSREVPVFLCK